MMGHGEDEEVMGKTPGDEHGLERGVGKSKQGMRKLGGNIPANRDNINEGSGT